MCLFLHVVFSLDLEATLYFSLQVWQCPSGSSSTHKRSQFELLAELEHDSGVSEDIEFRFYTVRSSTVLANILKKVLTAVDITLRLFLKEMSNTSVFPL